jgi:hypothetical protein
MKQFRRKPGTRSAFLDLKTPFPDATAFEAVVRSICMNNPFGCISYMKGKKNHQPVERVREMYTAKFVYEDPEGRRIGTSQETYNSLEGYQFGIHAVICNMANVSAHRGKIRHLPDTDHFSVILKCHDPNGEFYFLSLARDRVTVSSFTDDEILTRVELWKGSVPAFL